MRRKVETTLSESEAKDTKVSGLEKDISTKGGIIDDQIATARRLERQVKDQKHVIDRYLEEVTNLRRNSEATRVASDARISSLEKEICTKNKTNYEKVASARISDEQSKAHIEGHSAAIQAVRHELQETQRQI